MEGIQTTIKFTGPGDNVGVIKVGGYIDTTTSSELERSLGSLLKKNMYRIIVDLGDVDYISSAGWGIFISEIKGIKENSGDLKLVRMIPEVYEVFELLEFHYILKAYDTIEDAVDAFVKEAGGNLTGTFKKEAASSTATSTKAVETEVEEDEEIEEHHEKMLEEDEGSVDDHIRNIAKKYPTFSAWQIKKMLNTPEFGYAKLGWFEIRRKLKELKLR